MTLVFKHLATAANGATEIEGTGLRVYTILGLYEMGDSAECIAENYEVPTAAVYEALAYAADHPEEIEAIARADHEAEQHTLGHLPEHLRQIAERGIAVGEEARREAIQQATAA